jgi:hypothetical protein
MKNESDIELRVGLDKVRVEARFPNYTEDCRFKLIESHHLARAWKWLLDVHLYPKFYDVEIVSSHISNYAHDLYIYILIKSKEDIQPYLDLFEDDPNWELYDAKMDIQKRVGKDWIHGAFIRYNYSPTDEFTAEINKRFGGKMEYIDKEIKLSKYAFDVYLDFYPAENGDCAITELGEVKEVVTRRVFEITCGEGAREMRELLTK